MKELEKLRQKAAEASIALYRAEDELKNKEVLPLLKKMLGKCFKYHNSYGGDYERWWLYAKVVAIDEKKYNITVVEFQRTSMEKIEVQLNKKTVFNGRLFFGEDSGYYPITRSEYNSAAKNLKKFIIEKLDL